MAIEFGRDHEIVPAEETLITALTDGLVATFNLHEKLGDAGKREFQPNRFGETALAMDVQAEETLLHSFRVTHIPFQAFSEEHGEFIEGTNPQHTVVIDGLDGSGAYQRTRGLGMYGTMASILKGTNPIYDAYLASGIMIHSPTPILFLAIKGKGCFLIDIITGERKPLPKLIQKKFSQRSIIDLDVNWEPYFSLFDVQHKRFPNMQCAHFSAAARCALFVQGEIDAALEFTRKGNLEQPVIYGLTKEIGGVMITAQGEDIGDKHFRTFGQTEHLPLIIAPNQQIAQQISAKLDLININKQ